MATKVTIYDIADKLGLSPSTVSRALGDNSLISTKTRIKVKTAAAEMGYKGTCNEQSNPNTVAIIIPQINNYFYSSIISAIQDIIGNRFLIAVMCSNNSYKTEKEIVSRLDPSQIKCLVISQSMDTEDSSHLKDAEKKGISVIPFNRVYYSGACPKFVVDNYMDSYMLTDHLVTSGCRKIAFAAKHYNCPIYKERIQAYKDILKQNGLAFNEDYLIYSELTVEDTNEIISRFIKMTPRPDALIMPNFISALQAISIAKLNNLSVPQDIAIVSFDEDPECRYSTPSITGIDRPGTDIGKKIAKTVLLLCDGESAEQEPINIFSSKLVIRGSSFSY